jgi:hypothetical protein
VSTLGCINNVYGIEYSIPHVCVHPRSYHVLPQFTIVAWWGLLASAFGVWALINRERTSILLRLHAVQVAIAIPLFLSVVLVSAEEMHWTNVGTSMLHPGRDNNRGHNVSYLLCIGAAVIGLVCSVAATDVHLKAGTFAALARSVNGAVRGWV